MFAVELSKAGSLSSTETSATCHMFCGSVLHQSPYRLALRSFAFRLILHKPKLHVFLTVHQSMSV
jgi:hypothetical protein